MSQLATNLSIFNPKIVSKLTEIRVWDPGSEIRDPEKTYPGSRSQKNTGSRIRNSVKITKKFSYYHLSLTVFPTLTCPVLFLK